MLRLIYTIWCCFWLVLLFLVLWPATFIFLQRISWYPYAHQVNRIWGKLFFFLVGIKVEIDYRFRPAPSQTYIFCANHFSYLDIAVMGVILNHYFAFVGKHEVKNIPLFGYMFRKLHIQVNRVSNQSRASSLHKALKTLAQGRSIVIFPEGGIRSKKPPQMHSFMDGAFKMAIQQQVPIVPITLLTNYLIVADQSPLRISRHTLKVVVHKPLTATDWTAEEATKLKEACFQVIQTTLDTYHQKKNSDTG
ncbi:MAG: lysophospholipid acyltransferase family protein [Runella sp.]